VGLHLHELCIYTSGKDAVKHWSTLQSVTLGGYPLAIATDVGGQPIITQHMANWAQP